MKRFLFLLFLFVILVLPSKINAINCEDQPRSGMSQDELISFWGQVNDACTQKISSLNNDLTTLKQAISTLDSKIYLAQAQINQTQSQIDLLEKEITVLNGVLTSVNQSMTDLSKIYIARVQESYRRSRISQLDLIFSSESFGDFFTKLKYLNTVKAKDQLILKELENSKQDYDQRKQAKVTKQQEVESLKSKLLAQKKTLDAQKKDKNNLLSLTQNDEKKFEEIRRSAQAELAAIQDIIAGKGVEEFQKDVKTGDKIASIIEGGSCSSTGTHLHFTVAKGDSSLNPTGYLKSMNPTWDLCGWWSPCDNSVNFSGSWDWPLHGNITITQLYGLTGYAKTGVYGYYDKDRKQPVPHNGVDMVSDNREVYSTIDGKLYRGSYYIKYKNCYLRYVSVKSNEGDLRTLNLHINYL